jgi:hypothetical protein
VALHCATQKLLRKVELGSGKTLVTIVEPLNGIRGHSQFSPDGAPQIFIDDKRPITEEVIVHELSHLSLLLDGYPTFIITPQAEQPSSWEEWSSLLMKIADDISHHVFFPKLRAMSYQPNAPFREQIDALLSGSDLTVWAYKDFHYMAETDFRIRLEEQDHTFVEKFEKLLVNNGMQASVKLGEQMAATVGSLVHWNRQEILDTFIRCGDLFLAPYMRLRFNRWNTLNRGRVVEYLAELSAITRASQ